mgnify:CR=1 FL=1
MSIFTQLFGSVDSIHVSDLQEKINDKNGLYLLDVRTMGEYRDGHIPGAASIPLDRLEARLTKLSKNKEIICICRSGSRSKRATRLLQKAGFNATNMQGGMNAWQNAGYKVKSGKVK